MPTPSPIAAENDAAGLASGRRFVTAAVIVVLVLWGSIYLVFRQWRSGYRERADFGARYVATAIDPLATVVPDGAPPEAWQRTVAETHAMLAALTAANIMDRGQMESLGRRVSSVVSRSRPATALDDLASLWDEIESRAGPIVRGRHPRPKMLAPYRAKAEDAGSKR